VILALVGPTASGKTRIALELAPALGAEVLSVDSMQVYRGMDVGTAKPSASERRTVPHHLLDLAEPGQAFSVAEFQRAALAALDDVNRRGRTPILAGGSGLYFRAVVDELAFPPTDAAVRARLDLQEREELWRRLVTSDPDAAARIQPSNKRRIVRALEVAELTGRPFSSFRTSWESFASEGLRVAGLDVPLPALRVRIEERTTAMFDGPIQAEAARLRDAGHRGALQAAAAIGYRDALDQIEGRITRAEAVDRTVKATVDLARRQMRWFRRDPRIEWIDATDIERAAGAVRAYWAERSVAAAGGA
jgi:tRNA dimethylallyltransferase